MSRKRSYRIVNLIWLSALMLASASLAQAQVSSVQNYGDIVQGGVTYLDLIRRIFPDAEMNERRNATARTTIPLNHLSGDYAGQAFSGEMELSGVDSLWLRSGNRKQLLLMIHAAGRGEQLFDWGEISVLALYQLEPSVKLLDAAEVQTDRITFFWSKDEREMTFPISAQGNAVIIANHHFNSSQGYLNLTLVSTENNRLENIFEFPILLNEKACGDTFDQTPTISVMKNAKSRAHFNLAVEVKVVKQPDDEGCEKRTGGYYKSLLVWNASKRRYESMGNALARLEKFNEKRF
jgi:hypothetical protein